MRRIRWDVSAATVMAAGLVYFFDATGAVSALVPAALVHELGHILALRLCECRVTRVKVGLAGVELDYAPGLEGAKRALCCLAGPLFGFAYAALALGIGGRFLRMSGGASLVLSGFNLLPALPLDGGRTAAALLPERVSKWTSRGTALALLIVGAWLALKYGAASVLLMGVWLTVCNWKSPGT